MVQVPVVRNVACVPETVQTLAVVEAKATVRLEVAVAESVSGVPTVCAPGLLKVMVCAVSADVPVPVKGISFPAERLIRVLLLAVAAVVPNR